MMLKKLLMSLMRSHYSNVVESNSQRLGAVAKVDDHLLEQQLHF